MVNRAGLERSLVASNHNHTKFWRVDYIGGERHTGHVFKLSHLDAKASGPAFTAADFPAGSGISIWESGVGTA